MNDFISMGVGPSGGSAITHFILLGLFTSVYSGTPGAWRIHTPVLEDRTYTAAAETRAHTVAAEDRTYTVAGDD